MVWRFTLVFLIRGSQQCYQIARFQEPDSNTSGHGRHAAQRPVDLDEVVREIAERNGCGVVPDLFAEGVY